MPKWSSGPRSRDAAAVGAASLLAQALELVIQLLHPGELFVRQLVDIEEPQAFAGERPACAK